MLVWNLVGLIVGAVVVAQLSSFVIAPGFTCATSCTEKV